jgi:hypothetical protein
LLARTSAYDAQLTQAALPNIRVLRFFDWGFGSRKSPYRIFVRDRHGLYACRRGFGTLLYLAGCTLAEVADAMGNSPEVVFENYFKDKESTLGAQAVAKTVAAMKGRQANRILEAPIPELEGAL